MTLFLLSRLASTIQSHSSKRLRSERVRRANRVRYHRNLIVGELLEDRALLAPLIGTLTIGPSGDNYATIGAAIADVQSQGLGGAVTFELQSDYIGTIETYPLVFSSLGTTVVNTLTLRPASDVATAITLSSADTTAATVDLNGAQYVTIDGRPGGVGSNAGSGVGTASKLTIANTSTSTSGVAMRFINEASNNTLRYTTLRGVNTSASSGTVVFSTTTGVNGNDNNTIDHCDIRDGASTPANGIYSLGTTTTPAQGNSGNTVTNCNVFNFYASVDAAGVRLDGGNTDWSITGNSFYQTGSRTAVAANVRAIYINNTSGNNFTVTGNFIGGTAPNAGGTAWTTTGTTAAYLFQGIQLNVGTTTPSSVQGNTIANMVWTSNSTASTLPSVWSGIYVQAGNVNIGTVTGNTIGSGTGTGSISVTTSGGASFGIGSDSSGTVAIANNTIGSITANSTASNIPASLIGIQVTAGANTISNNTVGSTTTANSLNAANSWTAAGAISQRVIGIVSSSSTSANITGNTVANLNNNAVGGGVSPIGVIRGIATTAGVNTITGNTVRNLSTTSANIQSSNAQSVVGIADISTAAGQTVSQNTVHSLANTHSTNGVSVTGIYIEGPTSGTNLIARNFVHSLAVSTVSASSQVNGMQFAAGTFTAQNNMVRVGLKADGTSTAGASVVRGIYDIGTTAGRNFYHNSVYLGGTQTTSASNTVAFQSSGSTNARTFQNNFFVNARSNSGATTKHYAVQYGGTGVNPTGLTAGGNIFLASGTGGVFGRYNSADVADLSAWQAATGQDATSFNLDPRFINPTGTSATVDLHLQSVNPAEAKGVALAAVTDDFDGQTRSSRTPTDIGADAGNFIYAASSTEQSPVVSFTPAANTSSTANRVLTGFATITDDVSVASGGNAPRLYFKKSTEADAFVGNTSADNGWKYVTAGNASSPYNFTVDYALLTSSARGGDVIEYFVFAQDGAGNFASSPSGASYSSAAAPVTTINARPATVQSYRILSTDLSALTLSSGTLAPGFAANLTTYTATVANSVSSLLVTPTPADSTATVTLNGSTPASPVGLSVGANTLTIVVTATDSTTKTYTLTVTRGAAANAAPTAVVLSPSAASFAENASTASATELSTITITDDGVGTNTSSLSGADAASFDIVAGKLYLKAGVTLDFETKPSYSVRVNVDDATVGGTPDAFADFTLSITDIADAPVLTSVVVNGGDTFNLAAQRSQVTSLVVTFNMPVVLGSNPFTIVDNGLTALLGSPVPIDPSQIIVTGSGTTYTIRFGAGPGVVTRDTSTGLGRGNSLADGNFLLTIDPSKVTDLAALQTLTPTNSFGDGDNEFGDRAVDNFFRLFGDADGNGVVNSLDTGAFSRAISTYNAAVDFNGDGAVQNSGVDRTNFLGNFNKRRRSF